MSELEMAWEMAYSIEPRNPRDLEYLGVIEKGRRKYLFYKDTDGKYWYKTKI